MSRLVPGIVCCVVFFWTQAVYSETGDTVDGPCFPACRTGFICHQETCISACNPPCPAGRTCNANGQCQTVAPAALPQPAAPAALTVHDQRAAIRQQRVERRMRYRKTLRLILPAQFGLGLLAHDSHAFYLGRIGAGLRKNIIPSFGVFGSAAFVFGIEENLFDEDSDFVDDESAHKSSVFGFSANVGAYAGPLGRFYIGPVFGVMGLFPSKDEATAEFRNGGEMIVEYEKTLVGNFGIGMGVLAGPREEININWRIISSFDIYEMPIFLLVGVSFDLPLSAPAGEASGDS